MSVNNDSNFDDGTGLSAFDDLDPVSAVSELSSFPDQHGHYPGLWSNRPWQCHYHHHFRRRHCHHYRQ